MAHQFLDELKNMLAIPENVLARFNEVLKQRAVHETVHVYSRKWLRYFLDFCEKYPLPASKSEQVRLFIEKLKSKKQTPQQCTQAAHAVSLFFELQQPINGRPKEGKTHEACQIAYFSAQFCHPSFTGQLRHTNDSNNAGAYRRENDDDLYQLHTE